MTALAALTLGACVPAVTALKPVPGIDVKTLNVRNITVKIAAPTAPPDLAAQVQIALTAGLDQCAKGSTDIDLAVRIDNFKEANPVTVMLVGDVTNMAGSVRLVKLPEGAKLAEYYIEVGNAGGGLLGLAITSNPGEDLSEKFTGRICEEIFLHELPKEESSFEKERE